VWAYRAPAASDSHCGGLGFHCSTRSAVAGGEGEGVDEPAETAALVTPLGEDPALTFVLEQSISRTRPGGVA